MKIGICSIQRNRGKWLTEWIAFHHLVGCTDFYLYLHKCTDNSKEIINNLTKFFNIKCFEIGDINRPQLAAYQHCYQNFGHEIDWMAFIDGDEFLFPSNMNNISDVLKYYQYQKVSALGVYWQCFGSSGHIKDPNGLIIEDYIYRANLDFLGNRHIKSIVKGNQGEYCSIGANAHLFNTIYGTFDELMRPINNGLMDSLVPSYEKIRINHYVCQSLQFFKEFKQLSGSADAGSNSIRSDEWWSNVDRNDEKNFEIQRFLPDLNKILIDINFLIK